MDPFTAAALVVVTVAIVLYLLYWAVRRAVRDGLADARDAAAGVAENRRGL